MARNRSDQHTLDLFDDVYPVRTPKNISGIDFEVRLCRAIAEALKECGESREVIACKIAEFLGEPSFSKAMLDAYASPGRAAHKINIQRFIALIHATKATWLLDMLAEQFGCYVMASEEAAMAQLGMIDNRIAELTERKKEIKRTTRVPRRRA